LIDPVTHYAEAVRDGKIVAARLVRLACDRHLRDLKAQKAKGLDWRPQEAIDVIDFFANVLCLPESNDASAEAPSAGQPFVLSPWQQFIVGSLFGWYTAEGFRRFRVAYVEISKGSGKTPMFAGCLLYMLVTGRGAQLFCAAVTKDQAKLAFTDCERMVHASPHLRAIIDQKVNNLAVLETGSVIRPVSSEKRGLDGKRVEGAIIDEEHEQPTDVVYLKMRAGTKGRQNAIIFIPTNSGFDKETVCGRHHDYSIDVLRGTVDNDQWFAFVCHLDSCAKCFAAGSFQPSDDCPDCDDWKTEGPHWLKAAPNLGVSVPWQYQREQVREAKDLPTQRNMVRRLNFCQWTQQDKARIPPEAWAACQTDLHRDVYRTSLIGRECYIGIDPSDKIDLTSVVLIFPRPIDRPVTTATDAPITVALDVLPFFWIPDATMRRRAQEDKIGYPEWKRDGWLLTNPGSLIDHDALADYIISTLAPKFKIRGIGIDQSGAAGLVSKLQRQFGDALVKEIPQGFRRLSEPQKLAEALIFSGHLTHDANPCMAWCVLNIGIEENQWREIRPVKLQQRKRIDGWVALIGGIAQMIATPRTGRSIYEQGPREVWV
jgi:phage terminase large subunit-like protein